MHGIMRGGFVLIGAYVIATSLMGVGRSVGYSTLQAGMASAEWSVSFVAAPAVGALVFGVLPGAFLVVRSRQLASKFFPGAEPAAQVELHTLLCALVALLGAYLVVTGFGDLVGHAVAAISMLRLDPLFAQEPISTAVAAAIKLVAGVFLFVRAPWVGGLLAEGP